MTPKQLEAKLFAIENRVDLLERRLAKLELERPKQLTGPVLIQYNTTGGSIRITDERGNTNTWADWKWEAGY